MPDEELLRRVSKRGNKYSALSMWTPTLQVLMIS